MIEAVSGRRSILLTGFPGFLGARLLGDLLERDREAEATCLVQPRYMGAARVRLDASGTLGDRVQLVEGDITRPGLGLDELPGLKKKVTEIFHLAAVYDLSADRALGLRVNVDGTRHMLDLAEGCPGLTRFHHVSTCYVAGRYPGIFRETDLDKGQTFNNFYEETKFLSEIEVQTRMAGGLSTTVYRPAIVVGDSSTGETEKYDGPYFAIRWLLRQGRIAFMPVVGDPKVVRLNVVPSDFIVAAITHLSALEHSKDKVYQLADPEPLTIDEMLRELERACHRKMVRVHLPRAIAKWSLDHVPGVYRLLQIPSAAVDYFANHTFHDTTHASRDLEGSGIRVPAFASYVDRLIAFVESHPDIRTKAMV